MPAGSGSSGVKGSLGAHLRQLEKSGGGKNMNIPAPPNLPEEIRHVWELYLDVERGARTLGGFSANPMQWSEIGWWEKLFRVQLEPWEIDVIKRLDTKYISVINKSLSR